jgi:purine-binding chemotaxis protein CheW
MTDDSDDDRMDRARRIREMREGNRPDADDEPGGSEADTDPADADAGSEADSPDTDGGSGADPTDGGSQEDTQDTSGGGDAAEDFPGDWDSPAEGADGSTETGSADETAAGGGVDVPTDEDGVPQLPGVDVDDADPAQLAGQAELGAGGGGDPGEVDAGPGAGGGAGGGMAGAAMAGDADGADGGARAVGMAGSGGTVTGGTAEDETRVLEFALGDERYCLDIDHVEEIVKRETVTRVPNTPEYVVGVVDLRGQITTILDPKVMFDIDVEGAEELIVVFDPEGFEDQGAIGWLVDDVNQVIPVAESEVNDSPVDEAHVEGVVERDGEFVIWTKPELAVEDATE